MKTELKNYIIPFFKMLFIIFFLICFVAISISANRRNNLTLCKQIEIEVKNHEKWQFVTPEIIKKYIDDNGKILVINQRLNSLKLSEIEKRIEKNEYVNKAEVFSTLDGKVVVKVVQKYPIYRVFNNKGVSYYVAEDGEKISKSTTFTPRLFVVTGDVSNNRSISSQDLHNQIKSVLKYIEKDSFWKAMFGQLDVKANGDLVLYPKIEGQQVLIGDTSNLKQKFTYLKIFYTKALKQVDWTRYSTINLKYKGQIVCVKK